MSALATTIASFGAISGGALNTLFPNDLFYLDRGNDSCGGFSINTVFNSNDPNPTFAMRYAYMYSHSNGILDFFVESEINLAHRDWEDTAAKEYMIYMSIMI